MRRFSASRTRLFSPSGVWRAAATVCPACRDIRTTASARPPAPSRLPDQHSPGSLSLSLSLSLSHTLTPSLTPRAGCVRTGSSSRR